MRDHFAFQEWLDVSEARGQADMEKIDRHRGDPEQSQHEKRRDDDDAALEPEDVHRSTPRDHQSVDDEPEKRVKDQEHDKKSDRSVREESVLRRFRSVHFWIPPVWHSAHDKSEYSEST